MAAKIALYCLLSLRECLAPPSQLLPVSVRASMPSLSRRERLDWATVEFSSNSSNPPLRFERPTATEAYIELLGDLATI